MTTIERYALKPAVIGTTGFLMSKSLLPQFVDAKWDRTFSFASDSMVGRLSGMRSISVPVLAGVAVAGGSILAEIAHDYIFSHIHWMDKSSEKVSLLTAGGLSGAGMYGVIYGSNPAAVPELGATSIILAGVASEIVGDMIFTKFVKKPFEDFIHD